MKAAPNWMRRMTRPREPDDDNADFMNANDKQPIKKFSLLLSRPKRNLSLSTQCHVG